MKRTDSISEVYRVIHIVR